MIDPKTIAMLRKLEAKASPAPWDNEYSRKHVTTAKWKHYMPIFAECNTFENGDLIAEARNHLTAMLDEIERLQAELDRLQAALKTAHDELLRVRTRGHGAAHELDNIAVEAGLGANPQPGSVAAYVRRLRASHEKAIRAMRELSESLTKAQASSPDERMIYFAETEDVAAFRRAMGESATINAAGSRSQ